MIHCPQCGRISNKFELAQGRCSAPVGAEGYCNTRLPVTKKVKGEMSIAVALRISALELLKEAREKINLSRKTMERCGERAIMRKLDKLTAVFEEVKRDINQSFNNT